MRITKVALIFTFIWLLTVAGGWLRAEPTNSAAGQPPKKNTPVLVGPAEAAKLIADKKVVLLDLRSPAEFAGGHIAGATNLEFYHKDFKTKLAQLDKDKPYLVHCSVGLRSMKTCLLMSQQGFKTVYDLKGGIDAWRRADMPLVK